MPASQLVIPLLREMCGSGKTQVEGRPDRIAGDYALLKIFWSPVRDKSGKDIYHFMRDVAPGDIVLHLTDNRGFTGVSIASEPVMETVGVHGSEWEGSSLRRQTFRFYAPRTAASEGGLFLRAVSQPTRGSAKRGFKRWNTFYSDAPALNQGKYLTPALPELVEVLNEAYRSISGRPLIDLEALPSAPAPRGPGVE